MNTLSNTLSRNSPRSGPHVRLAVLALALASGSSATAQNGLEWATFFGGDGMDYLSSSDYCLAPNGDVVVAGFTDSTLFPVANAWQATYGGPTPAPNSLGFGDGFVARLSSDGGSLVWSTYLGGSDEDAILGVVADASGGVTVCGVTRSANFPTTAGAFQPSLAGLADGFVARFVWDGRQLSLLWSTMLGGSLDDTVTGLVVHPSGVVVVTGATRSTNFPMRGTPLQGTPAGGYDGFVAVLDATGSDLLASTYLGGSGQDFAWTWAPGGDLLWASEIVLDPAGNPVVAGITTSRNFPTTPNAFQPAIGNGYDGAVVRLDLGLSHLIYGTYLGGTGIDLVAGLAITPQGHIAMSGMTGSANFPTTPNGYKPTYDPVTTCPYAEGFVTVLDTRADPASQLVYSSFYGGTGCDHAIALAVDHRGMLLLGGVTIARNLPKTPGAHQPARAGSWDAYLAHLDTTQNGTNQLRYGTYLGGNCGGFDLISGILLDDLGNAIVIGTTQCTTFPTTPGAFQANFGGGSQDLIIAKMNLMPQDVTRFGHSTPACLGPIHQTVNSLPAAGNASFALEVCNAPPNAAGLIAFGSPNPPYIPVPVPGVASFLGGNIITAPLQVASANGGAQYLLPIPAALSGVPPYGIATQWFFLTTPQCPGTGPVASSEGLSW